MSGTKDKAMPAPAGMVAVGDLLIPEKARSISTDRQLYRCSILSDPRYGAPPCRSFSIAGITFQVQTTKKLGLNDDPETRPGLLQWLSLEQIDAYNRGIRAHAVVWSRVAIGRDDLGQRIHAHRAKVFKTTVPGYVHAEDHVPMSRYLRIERVKDPEVALRWSGGDGRFAEIEEPQKAAASASASSTG